VIYDNMLKIAFQDFLLKFDLACLAKWDETSAKAVEVFSALYKNEDFMAETMIYLAFSITAKASSCYLDSSAHSASFKALLASNTSSF
jgi:hypothetical protein